ncbi:MAG: hypothetical protein LBQ26_01625 [Holosporales bacterium]|nr:hypothetical protein [Holosporales bacterium]
MMTILLGGSGTDLLPVLEKVLTPPTLTSGSSCAITSLPMSGTFLLVHFGAQRSELRIHVDDNDEGRTMISSMGKIQGSLSRYVRR